MRLQDHLKTYTKDQLLDMARSLELKNYSRLRKAELIQKIMDCFSTKESLRSRLACLTKEQMLLFRKAPGYIDPGSHPRNDVVPLSAWYF